MILIEESKSISDLEQEYYDYLESHIAGVERSWNEILKPALLSNLDIHDLTVEDLDIIDDQISRHDMSKYEDDEFEAYRKWFYPVDESEKDQRSFDLAWLLHQKRNPHHHQYWVLIRDEGELEPLDMPVNYIIEMLCDWSSFQYKTPGSTANKWYSENKDKMTLSDNTRKLVEKYLAMCPNL